ncbi:MAG: translation elongation factor Ts [Candidatus Woykebacteria bacterium RBG_13_40_7b]|uniref:Elongation factor Ts n=1 Tax=Candidatus Woykebacteria bacterium RBG_13_40_7b TaxID=1802594 RepID=A0A1G1WC23_9BACT|nr:MAG: translation elongation factor Ts [Candidatus Woykebacteria bacterium RBG_13_40_7b]
MQITAELIKKLREETGAPVMQCREALVESGGDLEKAKKILKKLGLETASKVAERATKEGLIETYVHTNGKIAAVVEVQCETDFVTRLDEFKNLAHELAMQVASMDPKSVEKLLEQEYIRDPSKKVKDLVDELIAKLKENIVVKRIARFELGE